VALSGAMHNEYLSVMRRTVMSTLRTLCVSGSVCLAAASVLAVPSCAQRATRVVRVRIETEAGSIVVALRPDRAPITVANFLRYVDAHRYDGALFYRAVTTANQPLDARASRVEVIQGGLADDAAKRLPPIAHEPTRRTGLRHVDGTISMARLAPGTASSEFFIVINDQPALDFAGGRNPDGQGFAAFGRVVDGMDVVRRIQRMPGDSVSPQSLATPVRITRVVRVH
jgi:peptidyl-prolyl cis-trans isomerase A (cyclophilin A)